MQYSPPSSPYCELPLFSCFLGWFRLMHERSNTPFTKSSLIRCCTLLQFSSPTTKGNQKTNQQRSNAAACQFTCPYAFLCVCADTKLIITVKVTHKQQPKIFIWFHMLCTCMLATIIPVSLVVLFKRPFILLFTHATALYLKVLLYIDIYKLYYTYTAQRSCTTLLHSLPFVSNDILILRRLNFRTPLTLSSTP